MKQLLLSLFLITAGFGNNVAQASEYGCKVLLCLANPNSNGGPMGVTECRPPISQLYHDLAHGKPFPTCDLADGNNASQNFAKQVNAPYDPCPAGTIPAPVGTGAVAGAAATKRGFYSTSGIAAISEPQTTNDYGNSILGPQACVGNLIGSYTVGGGDRDSSTVQYNVYDKVVWQQPQSPSAIDVYVNGALQTRVHY
ncbi:hypothetical protein [Caballeronia sordidicola]|uniref:Secreted protein n=1 Tax=Caballeronia sordidicola TaxID=196367 RepID=A0A242MVN6_CABSO|nr:hypothetical protein [Caballeronia sordidicola]OTP75383.1 hypothetical protein PAMC26577_13240 [Caballeronia sordidicola]